MGDRRRGGQVAEVASRIPALTFLHSDRVTYNPHTLLRLPGKGIKRVPEYNSVCCFCQNRSVLERNIIANNDLLLVAKVSANYTIKVGRLKL